MADGTAHIPGFLDVLLQQTEKSKALWIYAHKPQVTSTNESLKRALLSPHTFSLSLMLTFGGGKLKMQLLQQKEKLRQYDEFSLM